MEDYNKFAKTFSQSRKNMRWQDLDEIIDDIGQNNFENILDIGCGNGRFIEFFEKKYKKNISYTGMDASSEMVLEAKSLHPEKTFIVGDMGSKANYPFEENSLDVIVAIASFHHLISEEERIRTFNIWKNLLKESGKIYLTNWNLREQKKYDSSHQWNGEYQIKIGEFTRYYHGFTLEELEDLIIKVDLKIQKHTPSENRYNLVSWLEK